MPDYQKSRIYKIVSDLTDDVYYGATTQKLCERMRGHRKDFKNWKIGKYHFTTSFIILEKDSNAKIIHIENYPCNSKEELSSRERHFIENNKCVNKYIPGRTNAEYQKNNIDKCRESWKKYNESHVEQSRVYGRKYYSEHKKERNDYGKKFRKKHGKKINEQRRIIYKWRKDFPMWNINPDIFK